MRITRLVVLGLLVAACVSAVAMAVDKQGAPKKATKEDAPEPKVTVTGVLHTTAGGYAVGSRPVSFGPPWYAAKSSLIKERLGKSVTVIGSAGDDGGELGVRTIDGVTYRAKGRPPWAGGPKHYGASASACKAKAKAAKAKADDKKDADDKDADDKDADDKDADDKKDADEKAEKAGKDKGGPPPWAKAYGRRCTS